MKIGSILPFIRVIIPRKMNKRIHPSPFTNRAATPVFIRVSRSEGCSQNLHPTFTFFLYRFLLTYDKSYLSNQIVCRLLGNIHSFNISMKYNVAS